jgi:hypothetical protein
MPAPAVEELLAAPLGCAFFLLAEREGLPVGELCRPPVAAALAAEVAIQLNPWTTYAPEGRAEVLGRAGEVRGLAADVLADPRSAWWWAPLAPRQVYLDTVGDRPRPAPEPGSGWSAYAQRPEWPLVTSTPYEGGSGLHEAVAAQVGDLDPTYPLAHAEVTVAAGARVYEVRGAADWRALARRHPVRRSADDVRQDPAGLASDVAPDWVSVGREWDGVHLSFGGLLGASLVPLGGPGERTTLWTWECEQTVWLRDAFASRVELPPLTGPPALGYEVAPFELATARTASAASLRPAGARRRRWFRRR